ncbi:MAG: hypothetical protein M0Z94_04950 [Dehalococcoidales bacterium]|nr:hypothetical protein [Dehalococcoidales bacterium]
MSSRKRARLQKLAAASKLSVEDMVKPSTVLSHYEPAARLLTPDAPVWLAEMLLAWSPSVWLQARMHEFGLPRAEMRERLRRLEHAVATIKGALGEASVRAFLDAADKEAIAYAGHLDAYLRDMETRVARALRGPELVTPVGKTKAGKGPALPPGAIHPARLCALIIAEAWKYVHAAYPGTRNEKAAEAAEAYWKACGNTRNSWGGNPLTAWRRRFEEAMSPSFDPHRGEVVHTLRASEQFARMRAAASDPGGGLKSPA